MSQNGEGSNFTEAGEAPVLRRRKGAWVPYWMVAVVASAGLVLAGTTAVSAFSAERSSDAATRVVEVSTESQPPQWWTAMQQLQRADYWTVYDCAPRDPYPVPCPDYTAKIVFNGEGRPTVTPARNANGATTIDLKVRQQGSHWSVMPVFSQGVQAFAYNQNNGAAWSGPRMFTAQVSPFSSVAFPKGVTLEVYAGSRSAYDRGAPLTPDRLGAN
jgi:hypothetical protein